MFYVDDGDLVVAVGSECPHCGSEHTAFDPYYGYWKCEMCSQVWGHDADDPDYDDE